MATIPADYQWRDYESACPYCACQATVFTMSGIDGWAFDGEAVRCEGCGTGGVLHVVNGGGVIKWDEELLE